MIKADALTFGNGGQVIVWGDEVSRFYGRISARGGSQGGNGGFVETSSKNILEAFGSVDASAPRGSSGLWLLDPRDVTVIGAAGAGGAFDGGSPNVFTPTADSATVFADTINASLDGNTSVTITTGVTGTQAGNITVNAPITKSAGAGSPTLTLTAAGAIDINSVITATSGSLNVTLTAGTTVDLDASITTAGGTFTSSGTTFDSTGNLISTAGGSVLLTHTAGVILGSITTTGAGALTVSTSGTITDAAGDVLTIGGTSSFTTTAGNSLITLDNASSFTGAVSLAPNGDGNVTLTGVTSALNLGTVTVGGTLGLGSLVVSAAGPITDTGVVTATGTASFTAGALNDITLNSANNFVGDVTIVSGKDVTLNDTGAIQFGGASTISGFLAARTGKTDPAT